MPRMISLSQAAEETGVSYGCLRRLCNQGKLVHIRSGKKILLNAEKLAEYLNTQRGDE